MEALACLNGSSKYQVVAYNWSVMQHEYLSLFRHHQGWAFQNRKTLCREGEEIPARPQRPRPRPMFQTLGNAASSLTDHEHHIFFTCRPTCTQHESAHFFAAAAAAAEAQTLLYARP